MPCACPSELIFIRMPGFIPYQDMMAIQRERRDAVASGHAPDTIYLLQHSPVITAGRDARPAHILSESSVLRAAGIECVKAERGGDVTYHGPGQLVAYPILNLAHWRRAVGWYLRALEEVLIRTVMRFGLHGERTPGYTGVWVNGAKVAAIGVAIRQWVTWHGIALNVNPDMQHFAHIVPCGIRDKPVTSLELLLGSAPPMDAVMAYLEKDFRAVFAESVTGR